MVALADKVRAIIAISRRFPVFAIRRTRGAFGSKLEVVR
jgi:hypothetical protein